MPATLDDRLRALGDDLLATSAPITRDELGTVARVVPMSRRRTRRRLVPLVGIAAAAAVVVGLVVVASRPDHRSIRPADVADGRVLLAKVPDGWSLDSIEAEQQTDASAPSHLYENPSIESRPRLVVKVMDARWEEPFMPESRQVIDIAGHEGTIYTQEFRAAFRYVSYRVGEQWVEVGALGLNDDELVSIAGAVVITDGTGSIPPEALPAGYHDLGLSRAFQAGYVSESISSVGPTVRWQHGDSAFWVQSMPGEVPLAMVTFFETETQAETVRGAEGLRFSGGGSYLVVVWHEAGRTFAAGGTLEPDELVAMVNDLRPATDDEWQHALDALQPDGPPATIPVGATYFPVIPKTAAPGLSVRAANAQYVPFGDNNSEPTWAGVVGPPGFTTLNDLVVITVGGPWADASSAPEGTTPEVTAEKYGDGRIGLTTERDGYWIVVAGADVGVLRKVIDSVQPTVVADRLAGYSFSGSLPEGMQELSAPYDTVADRGAFPSLMYGGGLLSVSVTPVPAVLSVARNQQTLADFSVVDSELGTAYLLVWDDANEAPSGMWITAYVPLADGTTLTVSTANLTQADLLALLDQVQLVSQAEWETTYHPLAALVPDETSSTEVPVTTAAEANG